MSPAEFKHHPDFKVLFESVPNLYLVLNPEFYIIGASDAYLKATMVIRENVLGRHLFDVFPDNPDDLAANGVSQLRSSLNRVLTTKSPDAMAIQKYDIRKPDGAFEERHWSPQNFPVLDQNQNIQYIIHRAEDVTEFVKLKQEKILQSQITENLRSEKDQLEKVRQSQRMEAMGQLAGGIAHDFNNILASIVIICENTLSRVDIPDFVKKNVTSILKSSERAAALVRQLLAFSRKQVLQPHVLNPNTVVQDMHDLLERLISEQIQLDIQLDPKLDSTLIDKGQLEQIILNLCVNARDAMPKGGKLTITTSNKTLDKSMSSGHLNVEPGNYVMISVQDTGVGMDAETQARIFEPFFTTKPVGKGTGLGLATVYGIIKQNKGTIWVYSELNKGTAFKIYLPKVDPTRQEAPAIEEVKPVDHLDQPKTILVVEDEEQLRTVVCEALRTTGYTVHEARNGLHALSILKELNHSVDLIISDVIMPEMGGRDLTKKIKLMGHNIKMLYLSGYTNDILEEHGVSGGHPHFLEKPFRLQKLQEKVRAIISS